MSDALNLTLLDELCLAHVASPSPTPPPAGAPPPSWDEPGAARAQAEDVTRMRVCFAAGEVALGCISADALSPGSLDNPRFQLELRIHMLVERIAAAASGNEWGEGEAGGGYEEALRYARNELAPFAQEAFADAYSVFVKAMLMFVYPERVAGLEARRTALADKIAATLVARCGAKGSQLSFLVRYLVVIHCGKGQAYASVVSEGKGDAATDALRIVTGSSGEEMKDDENAVDDGGAQVVTGGEAALRLGARPLAHGSLERGYTDAELLSLCDRLPGAVKKDDVLETMRYAEGDIERALLLELSRVQLDDAALDRLVDEYLALRGLGGALARGGEHGERAATMESLRQVASLGSATLLVETATQIEPGLLESSPALQFRIGQATLVEEVRAGDYGKAIATLKDRLGPLAFANVELMPSLRETSVLLAFPGDMSVEATAKGSSNSSLPDLPVKKRKTSGPAGAGGSDAEPLPGAAPGRTDFVPLCPPVVGSDGDGGEAEKEIDIMDVDDDAAQHDDTAQHDDAAEHDDAAQLPVAAIRASVLESSSAAALAAPIFRAVGRLGEEPRLAALLARLLGTHANWLAASGMRSDHFGDLLALRRLAEPDDSLLEPTGAAGPSAGAEKDSGVSGVGSGVADADDGRDPAREQKILMVREFLSMTRADAISLLDEHPTLDVNGIIELVMGG